MQIMSETTGKLLQKYIIAGQKVQKGDLLFVIDNQEAEAELNQAIANLRVAEAQESSAELEYESIKNLYAKQIVSETMLRTAQNDYDRTRAATAQAQAAVTQARKKVTDCNIYSPVTGLVSNEGPAVGEIVNPYMTLTTISANNLMKASFSLSEVIFQETVEELGSIDKMIAAMPPVVLYLKNGTKYEHMGSFESISGVVDRMTGTVTCTATFPNPDGKLYSGLQGTVEMPYTYHKVKIIPLTAVLRVQDKAIVYRVGNDSCAVATLVEITEVGDGQNAAVMRGVDNGDVIVANGANNVYDGQKVLF